MKLIKKCKLTFFFTIIFSLSSFMSVFAASKYVQIDTLKAYTQSASVDLNGDKVNENITFNLTTDEYGDGEYTLTINGNSVKAYGESLEGNFRIIDMNTKDKYKEIAIQEYGPSEDYAMTFYSYDGKNIISMGKLEGYGTSTDGAGNTFTNARGSILCTWFYKDYYKLSSKHTLQRVPRTSYPMNFKVTVKIPISLQTSPTNSKVNVTLNKGEKVTIVSSDNKKWCLVQNSKGQKGWFAVTGFDKIIGTNYYANEVFDGLLYAD